MNRLNIIERGRSDKPLRKHTPACVFIRKCSKHSKLYICIPLYIWSHIYACIPYKLRKLFFVVAIIIDFSSKKKSSKLDKIQK